MRPYSGLLVLSSLLLLVPLPIVRAQMPPVTIRAARLLDGRGQVVDDVLITVEKGRITRVEHPPAGAQPTIELKNLTLLPGLIDTHAHVGWYFNRQGRYHDGRDGDTRQNGIVAGEANVHAMLHGGITTIQSPGAAEDKDIRDRVAAGAIPGPRILTSLQPLMNPRTTPDEFRATVRTRKQQGADIIKVFASGSIRDGGVLTLTEEQLRAICGEAKAVGLRVMIHAHSPDSVKAAAMAGGTQIEHGVFVTEENLKLLADRGIYFDPQIDLVMRNYLENRAKYQGIGNFNDAGFKTMSEVLPQLVRTYQKALATPGLKIIFGSDAVAGSHGRNVDELFSRVKLGGQKPMDALVSAASLAAEAIGLGKEIGTIAPGYAADLIATDGDPSRDIAVLRRVVFVMKGGKVYLDPAATPPAKSAVVGKWLCVSGPAVPVLLDFTKDGTLQKVESPGEKASSMRYILEAGHLILSDAAGKSEQYHIRVNDSLMTLDEDNGRRFFFRRQP
jgi:imidazolonepropionase-like amidohydrolase